MSAETKYDGIHTFEDGKQAPYVWSTRHAIAECAQCREGVCRQKVILLEIADPTSGNIIVHCGPAEFS